MRWARRRLPGALGVGTESVAVKATTGQKDSAGRARRRHRGARDRDDPSGGMTTLAKPKPRTRARRPAGPDRTPLVLVGRPEASRPSPPRSGNRPSARAGEDCGLLARPRRVSSCLACRGDTARARRRLLPPGHESRRLLISVMSGACTRSRCARDGSGSCARSWTPCLSGAGRTLRKPLRDHAPCSSLRHSDRLSANEVSRWRW